MARILIVEHDPINAELVAIICKAARHVVTVVGNGVEALLMLDAVPFDLVLTDILMPRMDGLAMVGAIRGAQAAYADVPVIVMTATSDRQSVNAMRAMGIQGVVPKPFRNASLISVIKDVLAGPAQVSIQRMQRQGRFEFLDA